MLQRNEKGMGIIGSNCFAIKVASTGMQDIVSVHCREEGCIRLYIPKTKRYPEARREVQTNTSQLEPVYGHYLVTNPSLGMYYEIHPYGVIRIGSVNINTSLLIMRACYTQNDKEAKRACRANDRKKEMMIGKNCGLS